MFLYSPETHNLASNIKNVETENIHCKKRKPLSYSFRALSKSGMRFKSIPIL